ncbi:MAG: Mycothiol acetyltransferase [bacterium ADurb.Bin429]|nr:MAG: Mycothiol acetyltransferase [bacterium ADurb.Bin429]
MPEQLMPQLVMQRDDLEDLPPIALPDGYTLRAYRDGDGEHWVTILNESFHTTWAVEDFLRIMLDDPSFLPERIIFARDPSGVPCAVAAAYRNAQYPEHGYLHYVGCHPAHAGKRLGWAVSLACLYRFREEGCRRVVLQTDDFRLPAIKTYLRLGFHPVIVHENQHSRWAHVYEALTMEAS